MGYLLTSITFLYHISKIKSNRQLDKTSFGTVNTIICFKKYSKKLLTLLVLPDFYYFQHNPLHTLNIFESQLQTNVDFFLKVGNTKLIFLHFFDNNYFSDS